MGIDNVIREIIQKKFPPPPSPALDKGKAAEKGSDNYKKQEYTEHSTPSDAEYYPGTLNRDENGNKIITDFTNTSQFENSLKYHQEKNGGVEPKFEYPMAHMGFTKDVIDPPKPENGLPQVNYEFLKKMEPYLQDPNFNVEDIVKITPPSKKALLPDLAPYTIVGDPRWSHGAGLQAAYQEFFPKIDAWEEVVKLGGVQVIDTYICGPTGDPIKLASPIAIKYFNSKPPTAKEIRDFTKSSRDAALHKFSDAFVKFLQQNFLDPVWNPNLEIYENWEITAYSFDNFNMMLIKLKFDQKGRIWHWDSYGDFTESEMASIDVTINGPTIPDIQNDDDNSNNVNRIKRKPTGHWETYVYATLYEGRKFYYDEREYVAAKLKIPLEVVEGYNPPGIPDTAGVFEVMTATIPDYVRLVN